MATEAVNRVQKSLPLGTLVECSRRGGHWFRVVGYGQHGEVEIWQFGLGRFVEWPCFLSKVVKTELIDEL